MNKMSCSEIISKEKKTIIKGRVDLENIKSKYVLKKIFDL